MRRLFSRFPFLLDALTFLAFGLGAYWRYVHVFQTHDPRKFIYSDMKMYVDLAKRISKPGYELRIGDITHPPGFTELLAWFYRRDPNIFEPGTPATSLHWVQWGVGIAVVLSIGWLGYVAFDKTNAKIAIILSSLYYTFIEFSAFYLSEIYILLTGVLTVIFFLLACRAPARFAQKPALGLAALVGLAAVSGFFFSLSAVLKMVAAPTIFSFLGLYLVFTRDAVAPSPAGAGRIAAFAHGMRWKALALAVFVLAALPLNKWSSDRCTAANEGRFCTGSNKSAADFLLGHYGRIQGITWRDPKVRGVVGFGNPGAYQHGYREVKEVPFLITNQEKNSEYAWKWIRKNPAQAAVLSLEHVWDAFGGTYVWPQAATGTWTGNYYCHYFAIFFMLFPTGALLLDVARKRGVVGLLRSMELAIVSPLFGLCVAVAIATGEIRYRIPWEWALMLPAIVFYQRLRLPFWEPAAEGVAAAVAPPASAEEPRAVRESGAPEPAASTDVAGDDAADTKSSEPTEAEATLVDAAPPKADDDVDAKGDDETNPKPG